MKKYADAIFFNQDLCRSVTNPMIADEMPLRIFHRDSVAKHAPECEVRLKKGTILEGIVERVDFPNKGRVIFMSDHGEPYSVLVKNVLEGQRIRFSLKKTGKGRLEGRLLEVLSPSPLETEPKRCTNFGECGGCTYQTIPYDQQLKIKEIQVKQLLTPVCPDLNDIFEGITGSPSVFYYRNKMEYSFGDEYKDGPLTVGFHKRGSMYDLADASGCCLAHSDYGKIVSCVREHFAYRKIPHYKKNHEGVLRHLLIRRAVYTGELLISLITSSQYKDKHICPASLDLKELVRSLQSLPLEGTITGILHIINDSVADAIKCDEMHILYGQDYFYDEILGLRFRISTFSFFQTNTKGAEILYQKVREYINSIHTDNPQTEVYKDKIIFDLYSGTGTIAQLMAPTAKKVIGVEIVEEAVKAARANALENGIKNCEFIAGDVLKVIDEVKERPDLIILDPPRDGIHPKALKKICEYGVEHIIYISCKPTSLVRDLEKMQEYGYKAKRIGVVEQFPNTVHVECVVLMSRVEK